MPLLDDLRNQLRQRRIALTEELAELDDALTRLGDPEPNSSAVAANGGASAPSGKRGRRPGADAMRLEAWLRSWVGKEPGGIVRIDDAFRRAVAAGQTSDDRNGRERLRTALDRMVVREHLGETLGGGGYRFSQTAVNGGGP